MIPIIYILQEKNSTPTLSHVDTAIKSGCRWIQIKMQEDKPREKTKTYLKIKEICRKNDITLTIENNWELVKEIDCDGLFLTNGMPVAEARMKLGEGYLIGAMAGNFDEVATLKKQSADYLYYGCFAKEKSDLNNTLEECEALSRKMTEQAVSIPVCAFGEIDANNVRAILETGIQGIAITIDNNTANEEMIASILESYIKA